MLMNSDVAEVENLYWVEYIGQGVYLEHLEDDATFKSYQTSQR